MREDRSEWEVSASAPARGPEADVLVQLREHTRALHAQVERVVPILDAGAGRDEYRWYLKKLLGFHRPLEATLASQPVLRPLDLAARRKVPHLERDLLALGASVDELARLPTCRGPEFESAWAGYGALYVVEGATLGGQVVYRTLRARDPALMASASAYLRCYGTEVRERWRSFVDALIATPAGQQRTIVAAAVGTFQSLLSWLGPEADMGVGRGRCST